MGEPKNSLWIFGYGSLCWHPGFKTSASSIGFVKNYVRRFWQGNTTHRGTPEKPGRVATLVKEEEGLTWGVAYEITGESALKYLNEREVSLGGYTTELTTFYPRDKREDEFPVLLYIATATSKDWAGPAAPHEIATQIIYTSGPKGHNVEYLLRLAEFMREHIPEEYDDHLFTLETLVRLRIKENNFSMKALMGNGPPVVEATEAVGQVPLPAAERRDTFTYSTTLPKPKLRCLNV